MLKQFQPRKKIHWHWDKYKEWRETGDTTPVMFEFDPALACNNFCIWCSFSYVRDKFNNKAIMPRAIMLRTIHEMKDLGAKAINWTGGGEPLVNPSTPEGLKLAHSIGLQNGLYTNGMGLNHEINETIIDTCRWCRISLDAGTAATHSLCHGVPETVFPHVIEQMEDLVKIRKEKGKTKKNITLGAGMLVHPQNYKEIEHATMLVKELGYDYMQLKPTVMNTFQKKQIDAEFWEEKVIPRLKCAEFIGDDDFDVLVTTYKFEDIQKQDDHGRYYDKCLSHCFMGTISADCEVYLCCHLRGFKEYSFGNLKEKSLKEIWNGKQRQEAIKHINLDKCHILCKNNEINKELWDNINMRDELHPNFL